MDLSVPASTWAQRSPCAAMNKTATAPSTGMRHAPAIRSLQSRFEDHIPRSALPHSLPRRSQPSSTSNSSRELSAASTNLWSEPMMPQTRDSSCTYSCVATSPIPKKARSSGQLSLQPQSSFPIFCVHLKRAVHRHNGCSNMSGGHAARGDDGRLFTTQPITHQEARHNQSRGVPVVRLIAPVEPVPLAASSLYSPFSLAACSLPAKTPNSKSEISLLYRTPKKHSERVSIKASSAKTDGRASSRENFEASPVGPPRRSLRHIAGKADHNNAKSEETRYVLHHNDTLPTSRPRKTVADLRTIFDNPGQSLVSMPGTYFVQPLHARSLNSTSRHSIQTQSSRLKPSYIKTPTNQQHVSSRSSPAKSRTGQLEAQSVETLHQAVPTNDVSRNTKPAGASVKRHAFGSIPRSRLRAFINAKRQSGAWRRISSHMHSRGQSDSVPSDHENDTPDDTRSHATALLLEHADNSRNISSSSTQIIHRSRENMHTTPNTSPPTTKRYGIDMPRAEAVYNPPNNQKENRFRNWSWGHRGPGKASAGSTGLSEKESCTGERTIPGYGLARPTIVQSQCDLLQPKPVRAEDIMQITSFCEQNH
ncbi:hypothetical protein F503_00897 [Ophiostoma piceae UAMH 11346]|uniref:Uncharacterized protein n=1 Tax=Ophiostoma piceae (strain UAMH 11346) TaxID=1262450 RepID=S3C3L6_OPHP1|nr:hypothetical protein F503_00897 [Ophiostoma piceae UAMH 11346]